MDKALKDRLMSQLDELANALGGARFATPSDNLEAVGKHLELALDLLDGEPTDGAAA